MPNIVVQPATVPLDTAFPPENAQALLNFIAGYLQFSGLETLKGIIVATTEPAADDRDKAWIKQDAVSLRTLGIFTFVGGEWAAVPVTLPTGEEEPVGAKKGEMFFNTKLNAVRIHDGTGWTTNFWHQCSSTDRPASARPNYIIFDTTINRALRWTGSAWTTLDGAVGDLKMVDFADTDTALTNNPGWEVFAAMAGRFPVASSDDLSPQSEGGATSIDELKVKWAAKGRSAQGGSRDADASFIASISFNNVEAKADGTKMPGLTDIGTEKTLNVQPPYKAVIFLKKVL